MTWLLLNIPLMVLFFALWVASRCGWCAGTRTPRRRSPRPSRACPHGPARTPTTAASPSPPCGAGL